MPDDNALTYTIDAELYDNLLALLDELIINSNSDGKSQPILSFWAYWLGDGDSLAKQCQSDLRFIECDEYHCLVSDDDGHWYVIPVSEKENFSQWVTDATDGYESEFDFGKDMINTHPSSISFKNFYQE
jgi:hypothetical protein